MSIERFSVADFKAALPKSALCEGMEYGELAYVVQVNDFARIKIRSSIDESGYAASTGQDSIRLWLEVQCGQSPPVWRALKKQGEYTTRVAGWQKRMNEKMHVLIEMGVRVKRMIPVCEECGQAQTAWFVKKDGPNNGRPMSKCFKHNKGFTWLDEEETVPDCAPRRSILDLVAQEDESIAPAAEPDDWMSELSALSTKRFEKPEPIVRAPNDQQAQIIYGGIDKAVRVWAGPGTGKTFVIERKYAELVAQNVSPDRIVVVTFSKTQSQDMLERIIKHNPYIANTAAERQICTIHAFCLRELAKADLAREMPKQWEIKKLCEEIAAKLWPIPKGLSPEEAIKKRPAWDELMTAFNTAKNYYLAPGKDTQLYNSFTSKENALKLTRARDEFDRTMQGRGWWTFADMLYDMEEALSEDPTFRRNVQSANEYDIVDEGQDTNAQAMRILTRVAEPQDRLFIVGDGDQLLFRFAGATPEENLYDGFSARYGDMSETFMLETNYRSTQNIVGACNDLIRFNYNVEGGPYNDEYMKRLVARPDAPVGTDLLFNEYEDADEEAMGIVNEIEILMNDGVKPGQIFVLTRTRAQLAHMEGPMTREGIPFINLTGGSFWMLRHVRQLLGYIRVIVREGDRDAFKDIYNVASNQMTDYDGNYCATRWLGSVFLNRVSSYNVAKLDEAARVRRQWSKGIDDLIYLVQGVEHELKTNTLVDAIEYIIDNCMKEYLIHEDGVSSDDAADGKMNDLLGVADMARKFTDPVDFLNKIDDAIQVALDRKNKNWDDYVVISTVHRVKGLERDVVFCAGWSEGYIETATGTLPSGLLPHTFSLREVPSMGFFDFSGQSPLEDERCIAFVAISRARNKVFVSSIRKYRTSILSPSRFVRELMLV